MICQAGTERQRQGEVYSFGDILLADFQAPPETDLFRAGELLHLGLPVPTGGRLPEKVSLRNVQDALGLPFWAAPSLSTLRAAGAPLLQAHAVLAIRIALEDQGMLCLARDGILTETRFLDLGCPGAVAVVAASGLGTDLSEFNILEDEHYLELLAVLRGQFRQMALEAIACVGVLTQQLDYSLKTRVVRRLTESTPQTK